MRLPSSLSQRWSQMQHLRQVLPGLDALRIVCRTTRDRSHLRIELTPIGRLVTLRANTSDLKCLEKVFIEEEYRLPFDVNPAFDIRPDFIVDAGANIGMASLYFARAFPMARILAVEPEASNFELLCRNCAGIENVKPRKAALWPCQTDLRVANPTADNWCFAVQPSAVGSGTVESITVPQILSESGLDRIDLLKLDIEGAERALFDESCEHWLPKVGMIVIELHDRFGRGCSEALYSHLVRRPFIQEIRGENIFLRLGGES